MAPLFGRLEADEIEQLAPAQANGTAGFSSVFASRKLSTVCRSDFPPTFLFDAATSAYQVEGAVNEGGRGASIWDTFAHLPNKISDGSNGNVATDQYHRYEEDSELIQQLGFDSYRFSISWPRIFPDGCKTSYNKEGVAYYNRLIDVLLRRGITPFVTLYHWDLPQALQDAIGGWLSPEIVKHFADYAETCFNEFGDRVKYWVTLNEPLRFAFFGHGIGIHAPGRTSNRQRSRDGNSATEPYLVGHHALLAHAAAVQLYNEKFKAKQGGIIGIAVDSEWGEPLSDSEADIMAAQRHLEYHLGWFLDPIFFGDYPVLMKETAGDRLPTFNMQEQALLRNSLDFVGINHYTTRYVIPAESGIKPTYGGWFDDIKTKRLAEVNGELIGAKGASQWMYIVPWGFRKLVNWVTKRYGRPPIYITENGMDDENSPSTSLEDFLLDTKRVHYYQDYLAALSQSIREGADVRGYFAWSLMDNFEWESGYSKRFGLIFVDYNTLERYPKDSAKWFHSFLKQTPLPESLSRSHLYDCMTDPAEMNLACPQDIEHITILD